MTDAPALPQDCLFCKIAAGEIPSFKVYEDGETFAFLDINPSAAGHVLVIPKKHVKDVFEIDEQSFRSVAATTKRIADKIRTVLQMDVSVMQNNGRAAGQVIDHLHVHIIPRRAGDRLPISHAGTRGEPAALAEMQKKLEFSSTQSALRFREALSNWDRL